MSDRPGEVSGHFEAELSLIVRMRTDASERDWHEAMADLTFNIGQTGGVVRIMPGSIEGERKFIPRVLR
jgi:hypothetical protein